MLLPSFGPPNDTARQRFRVLNRRLSTSEDTRPSILLGGRDRAWCPSRSAHDRRAWSVFLGFFLIALLGHDQSLWVGCEPRRTDLPKSQIDPEEAGYVRHSRRLTASRASAPPPEPKPPMTLKIVDATESAQQAVQHSKRTAISMEIRRAKRLSASRKGEADRVLIPRLVRLTDRQSRRPQLAAPR